MKGTGIKGIFATLVKETKKHSPEILTGLGIAGMFTTTILAVKATPKAIELMNTKMIEEHKDELTKKEVVQTCWKCYIPAAVAGAVSTTCLIGASGVHNKRNAALTAAYKISESALAEAKEYKAQVVQTIGEKKAQEIQDKVAQKQAEKEEIPNVVVMGDDNSLCRINILGGVQYILSNKGDISAAVNEVNARFNADGYCSVNDYLDALGAERVESGDKYGWRANSTSDFLSASYGSMIAPNGQPCMTVYLNRDPSEHYDVFGY